MAEAKQQTAPTPIYRTDYRPPDYAIGQLALTFDLDGTETRVQATFSVRREPSAGRPPLRLDGRALELRGVKVNGMALAPTHYALDDEGLTLTDLPSGCEIAIETAIHPRANTALLGLYQSTGNLCTQCEAEGFRRITYFPDRPDVLTVYTTTLIADRTACPVLLSNGNRVAAGELDDGRHWVRWHDPFPKPSYLFALVAGDLGHIEDRFITRSGRAVQLEVYAQHHNIDKCAHAMASIKEAMRWDEETFSREYDLDTYMVVAVDDFNMGAMENKGLNIFNSKYVLARPETATDSDFQHIEGVIGHEYFHNWSGNRVTCRDWFQLSLKEGFTVFRDQEFSADMGSRGVKRIEDADIMRTHQFREDAGPMAHPVRPESYIEINNFYTLTVYHKGAEVVRMLRVLLGWDAFRRGTDLYFERHDGQAVTTEDFITAMEDATGADLAQFRRWYCQAGTPLVKARREHDAATGRYRLHLTQHCPPTPGQPDKQAMQIPLRIALFNRNGQRLPLRRTGAPVSDECVVTLTDAEQSIEFEGIAAAPVPSLLRGFSAPVKLDIDLDDAELAFLMAHDDDPFNRWDASQRLALEQLLRGVKASQQNRPFAPDAAFVAAFEATLQTAMGDLAFQALALTLPSEAVIADALAVIDPVAVAAARHGLRRTLAGLLGDQLRDRYERLTAQGPHTLDPTAIGRRRLRNVCLGYLAERDDADAWQRCRTQLDGADNMTDAIAALTALANSASPHRTAVLQAFYDHWRDDALVVDKWLATQATARRPDALDTVHTLLDHPAYSATNPNKVHALVGAFCHGNPAQFHATDGAGYRFAADCVLQSDPMNPHVSAHLAAAFNQWRRYDPARQALMKRELERIIAAPGLSRDVREIVDKTLA